MNVYIKGMGMPVFEHDSWDIRQGTDGKWYMVDTNAETTDGEWHEIIPIPPHGRLIDADRLGFAMMDAANADQALTMVDDAPTIIEADHCPMCGRELKK